MNEKKSSYGICEGCGQTFYKGVRKRYCVGCVQKALQHRQQVRYISIKTRYINNRLSSMEVII